MVAVLTNSRHPIGARQEQLPGGLTNSTEEFNGGRKRPTLGHDDVLAALGALLTEYVRINTLLDRANGRLTADEREQKQASNRTCDRIRSL